jgi:hypothetical protein
VEQQAPRQSKPETMLMLRAITTVVRLDLAELKEKGWRT